MAEDEQFMWTVILFILCITWVRILVTEEEEKDDTKE
jgi:hypothetical protein